MDNNTKKLLSLCHEPMLTAEKGKLAYMNAAARTAFPNLEPGKALALLLPAAFLAEENGRFTSTAKLGQKHYTVC